jgi:GNAT superfamily N-acetyltransferase
MRPEVQMQAKKKDELLIRAMVPGDADQVAQLTRQLGYERSAEETRQWIEGLEGNQERQMAFVACAGSEIAGWIEISMERRLQSPFFALIGGLVVSEQRRGYGIGRRLCERAEEWGWQRGAEKVRVTSRTTRADAHRFYVQNGYEVIKTSVVFEKRRR